MTTPTPTVINVPQPMIGMNWEPAPSDYTSLPAPSKYGDTDFANADFTALWGVDASGTGRNDLKIIAGLGCNTIKMYNWSVPAPNGYFMRDHTGFLAAAQAAGLSVIVPISNFFTGTAYNNRTSGGNAGGPGASTSLQNWITDIVTEVYNGNDTPGPVVLWAIGNEFDNSNVGAYGYCEAEDIATIASYIMAAEASLNVTSVAAFTSPVTTALLPVNTSITSSDPTYNTTMGGCAVHALLTAFNAAGIPGDRFVAAINSYQIGSQLTGYNTAFPALFPSQPWFYGELGFSAATAGASTQAENIYSQFSTTIPFSQASGSTYLGACCFEFSDEAWKGPSGSSETEFGIYTFAAGGTPPTATEGNHSPVWAADYPVDELIARKAVAYLTAAIAGNPEPTSETARETAPAD